MRIDIEPTPEMFDAPINGQVIPVRVWKGSTAQGVPIEAYVLSIVPDPPIPEMMAALSSRLAQEIPPFMKRSREVYQIDIGEGNATRVVPDSGRADG